jgi:CRISPR-associated protein Cmr3
MTSYHSWHFRPRDPLVFDSGARTAVAAGALPPQPSVAGCVRGAYFEARRPPDREKRAFARRLLDIELRGPWLLHPDRTDPLDRLLVPCPADLGHIPRGDLPPHLIPAELRALGPGEGIHLPGRDPPPRHLLAVPAKAPLPPDDPPRRCPAQAHDPAQAAPRDALAKVKPLAEHVLSLRDAVRYALDPTTAAELAVGRPFAPEHRTHVVLKPDTHTAEPEQLFVTRGRRLREPLELVVDVAAPADLSPPKDGPIFLGGESRPAYLAVEDRPVWPDFAAVRDDYRRALSRLGASRLALRLVLLTPGDFGGGSPPPVHTPDGRELVLLAACHGRHLAVSGWDLRKGGPRPVRRLVPAGAVYLYEIPPGADPLELCAHFWGRPLLHLAEPVPDATLAPPQRDGYGLVLPGLRLLPAPKV